MKTTVKLMAMATAMVALASCMDSDSVYDPNATAENAKAKYEKLFVQEFGKVASNQDWGFGTTSTRGSSQDLNEPHNTTVVKPAQILQDEVQAVYNAFNREINKSESVNVDWCDFFVQMVYVKDITYSTKDNNGEAHSYSPYDSMNKYFCGDAEDEVANLQAKKITAGAIADVPNTTQTRMLMQSSSTSKFLYEDVQNSSLRYDNFVILKVGNDYYVGFDFKTDGNNGKVEPDNYYNDVILKISPAVYTGSKRIMCEDLGSTASSDLDFNDVVFDAYITNAVWPNSGTEAVITLHAAGGTYPLTVGGEEVHALFGVSTGTMVNTQPGRHYEKPVVVYRVPVLSYSLRDIKVEVTIGGSNIELEAPLGGAASKICSPALVAWVDETSQLKSLYDQFPDYVSNPNVEWWEEN